MKTKTIRHIILALYCLACLFLGGFTHRIYAESVTLAWDQNPEPDVSYRLSYGTSTGMRSNVVEAGKNLEVVVSDLTPGTTYYFAVQAVAPDGLTSLPSTEIGYTIPTPSPKGWTVRFVDDEQADGYGAELAIDGNPATFWHTTWREGQPQLPGPHELQIDMGAVKTLSGFTILPRQDEWDGSNVKGYAFHTSLDGVTWGEPVVSGELAQGKQLHTVSFPPKAARYFRLVVTSSQDGKQAASAAELSVIESGPPSPPSAPRGLRITITVTPTP